MGPRQAHDFVYMGQGSVVPRDVTRVRVHPSVRVIAARACAWCVELVEVQLWEGLEEIGEYAFHNCKSLKRITLPSSLRRIARRSFWGCEELVALALCEGIEEIGKNAFRNCRSLKRATIPSSVRQIGMLAFQDCVGLVEVKLCEGLDEIGEGAFSGCRSLKQITLPSSLRRIGRLAFRWCRGLVKVDLCEGLEVIGDCAFADCKSLKRITIPNITGTRQDCLGMTPLHILACSTPHDMDLCQSLVEKYPSNIITEDKWGDLPILYAFWGNAPWEVVQLLVEGHKTYFPDHALDWGGVVVTLGEANAPDCIQNLFDTQQNHFPDQNINWEDCAVELARSKRASTETFIFFLRLSVANRLDALGVGKWQNKLENSINECSGNRNTREIGARLLYSNLASCEQMKEAIFLLELALWQAKMGEGGIERYQCRINCGAQVILPNVVPFLSPKWESTCILLESNPSDDDESYDYGDYDDESNQSGDY